MVYLAKKKKEMLKDRNTMAVLVKILVQDIRKLLTGSDNFNVKIVVGEGSDTKTFEAHSVILRARSSYFDTALSSTWARKIGEKIVFSKPNIAPNIFSIILAYVFVSQGVLTSVACENEILYHPTLQ